jgi:hypothetical protein
MPAVTYLASKLRVGSQELLNIIDIYFESAILGVQLTRRETTVSRKVEVRAKFNGKTQRLQGCLPVRPTRKLIMLNERVQFK